MNFKEHFLYFNKKSPLNLEFFYSLFLLFFLYVLKRIIFFRLYGIKFIIHRFRKITNVLLKEIIIDFDFHINFSVFYILSFPKNAKIPLTLLLDLNLLNNNLLYILLNSFLCLKSF